MSVRVGLSQKRWRLAQLKSVALLTGIRFLLAFQLLSRTATQTIIIVNTKPLAYLVGSIFEIDCQFNLNSEKKIMCILVELAQAETTNIIQMITPINSDIFLPNTSIYSVTKLFTVRFIYLKIISFLFSVIIPKYCSALRSIRNQTDAFC